MNRYITVSLVILSGLFLSRCAQNDQSLEGKQKLLLAKKAELRQISQEISQLEDEIAELDPTVRERAKVAVVGISEVKPRTFEHYIDVQGQVEAKDNVNVSAQTSGRLTSIFVKEGQVVRKGQVLAKVDDALIQASINEVNSQLSLAEDLLARQQRLWDQNIGTEIQLLEAKNRVDGLKKRLATQEEQRALTNIVSPINGTVDEIVPKTGEIVSPGMPAFRIVNNKDLSLTASLSEAYIPQIRKGDQVIVDFPAINESMKATIRVVGQVIHPNDRTFDIEVDLPNHPMLKPNMFGTLRINDNTLQEAVVLPLAMIQQSETGPFVYVAKQSGDQWLAERRNLTIGLGYQDEVAVEKGLAGGELLIASGYTDLSDGQEITFDSPIAQTETAQP